MGVLVALSGCGRSANPQPGANGHPESVRIEIGGPLNEQKKPVVTLAVTSLVQQLYATIHALPALPEQQACTADAGPQYALTFSEGNQTLETVQAARDGCHPVTITGETASRHGTAEFWTQLDLAIYQATPPAQPDQLAIAYWPTPAQAPQTARISSAETAQRLYTSILALPHLPYSYQCPTQGIPTYQLVFHTTQQVIPAAFDPTCKTITLNGAYQTRGGTYTLSDQFDRLLAEVMAGATFAPAQPDQLTLTIQTASTTTHQTIVANTAFMQQLYHKTFALPPTTAQPACLGTDKVAGKGTWYYFAFSQWGLPILGFSAYEGSCLYVTRSTLDQVIQGDQAFWDIIHQAASQH